MRSHLNDDEIERLLLAASDLGDAEPDDKADALDHLRTCESCALAVRAHREAAEELARLKFGGGGRLGSDCPSESVWLDLAAGISTEDSKAYLNHAAECEHCGPLLREAAADLAEDLSVEDEKRMNQLRTTSPEWQRGFAQRLSMAAEPSRAVPWWKSILTLPRLVLTGGLASAAAAVALWLIFNYSMAPSVDVLLAQAYAEKRVLEMRFEGGAYVPMGQDRGPCELARMTRPALLGAESEIAQRLKSTPDDVRWVHASGRASLLECKGEIAAVAALERARRLAPNDESIAIDLASAYFQRGEVLGRPEDEGHAVDLLGKVLASDPKNEAARFNYAIALEHISLYQQAIVEWQTFLSSYPTSAWANEARDRLSRLQEAVRQKQSQRRLDNAAEIATALQENGGESALAELNNRSESYLKIAVREWLPAAFLSGSSRSSSQTEWLALTALACTLEANHKDSWLQDLLRTDPNAPIARTAFRLISDVDQAIQVSDNDRAVKEAQRAVQLFKHSGSHAGELYARFQMTYANQLSHRNAECSVAARQVADVPDMRSYPWLRIQFAVEAAICASTVDERALKWLRTASNLATEHHYAAARSRSEQVLSAIYWTMGDLHEAWKTSADGLHQFWADNLPSLLGYNLLTNIDYIAQDDQEWFLQVAVLKESVPMIADHPDHAMRAFEQARLGQALLMTGSFSSAEASFRQTHELFQSVPDGGRKENLIAESEIGLAKIDVQRGLTEKAIARLGAIQRRVVGIHDDDLTLGFFQTYGIALLRAGKPRVARQNLSSAVELAEKGLRMVRGDRDRLRWSRRNEATYRAMVELTLREDPGEALAYWEWYKGASLREHGVPLGLDFKIVHDGAKKFAEAIGPDVALVSFFVLPHGIAVWVKDGSATHERWIDLAKNELEYLTQRFSEHCSEADSTLDLVRGEGAQLYERILLPVEPLIRGHHVLVLEPDGPLREIPFAALVDRNGEYLSDQYAISISPGIEYLVDSRSRIGIVPQSRALVVGNPTVPGWPSLPDAEREAQDVAGMFERSRLLTGSDATYEHIARELPDSDVFHFAGHATADLESAGFLVQGANLVESSTLGQLHLQRTQLVVLSACSSARGREGLFDDEDSLTREFIRIGAADVVASRWTVDSVDTAALMHNFYARLLEGGTVADSLASAAKDLRSQNRRAHPFYWAGFTVFGRG
ncbi:MAG TPA: CHAT domain-containing protein [Candidatus Polarisedimenticolia bacterium]|nr:CHAT domain-containing protein [Candidatus Polarisedimenticolia bacterium]